MSHQPHFILKPTQYTLLRTFSTFVIWLSHCHIVHLHLFEHKLFLFPFLLRPLTFHLLTTSQFPSSVIHWLLTDSTRLRCVFHIFVTWEIKHLEKRETHTCTQIQIKCAVHRTTILNINKSKHEDTFVFSSSAGSKIIPSHLYPCAKSLVYHSRLLVVINILLHHDNEKE